MDVERQSVRFGASAARRQIRHYRGHVGQRRVVARQRRARELRPQFGGKGLGLLSEPDRAQAAFRGRHQRHALGDRGDRPADRLAGRARPVPARGHAQLPIRGFVRRTRRTVARVVERRGHVLTPRQPRPQ